MYASSLSLFGGSFWFLCILLMVLAWCNNCASACSFSYMELVIPMF